MPGWWDLDIDTCWMRQAGRSVEDGGRCFGAVVGNRLSAPVSAGDLGRSASAAAAVALVNTRTGQADAAAAQLHAVAAAVGRRLLEAADSFDRAEAATGRAPR